MRSPIAVVVMNRSIIPSLSTAAQTDSAGRTTGMSVITVMATLSLLTETDSQGDPTATVTSYSNPPTTHTVVYYSKFNAKSSY